MNLTSVMQRILFPKTFRGFRGRRISRSTLRTIHILGGGVLIGSVLFDQPDKTVSIWFMVTILSGGMLLATDLHATFAILFEWRGLAVVAKIALLSLLGWTQAYEIAILVAILTIGSFSSHLSRKFRHRPWLGLEKLVVDNRHG